MGRRTGPVPAAGLRRDGRRPGRARPREALSIAAVAMVFAAAPLTLLESVIAVVVFCVIGSLGVALPLLVSRRAGSAGRARLEATRTRLVEDNTTIQAVTLLILGTLLVGQGLAG